MIRARTGEGAWTRPNWPTVLLLWTSWLGLALIQAVLTSAFGPVSDQLALLVVLVHVPISMWLLLMSAEAWSGVLVGLGFVLRVASMLVDIYAPFELPISASPDDLRFFAAGQSIARDLTLAGETYGGLYSDLLGYLFNVVGPTRVTAQYFNVLLGASALIFLSMTLSFLRIQLSVRRKVLLVGALMPASIFFGSQLLRESIVQACVALSLYLFVRYLYDRQLVRAAYVVAPILAASAFHAGAVSLFFGFLLAASVLDVRDGRLIFGARRMLPTALIGIAGVAGLLVFSDVFLSKFLTFESGSDVLESANRRAGGAAYLPGMEVESFPELIVFSPIRAAYFLFSPMPWDWRGGGDVLAFGMDSVYYLIPTLCVLRLREKSSGSAKLAFALLGVALMVALVFGVGVSNSGTAMRHRSKFVSVFLVVAAVAVDVGKRFRRDPS